MSRWPSKRRTSEPSATFQIAATPPRPATPEAVTRRWPSGVKCKAVTLPGKVPDRAIWLGAARRVTAVEADLGAAGDGQPAAVAGRVHRDHRPHRRVGGDLGHDQRQAVGLLTLRSAWRRPRSRPR